MLESVVYDKESGSQDNGGNQDQECRTLQLVPSGPRSLLDELYIALF